jgi:hypothetical protein
MIKRAALAYSVFMVLVFFFSADPLHSASVAMLSALTFVRL